MKYLATAASYALLLVASTIVLFPVYFTVAGSLMSDADLLQFPPRLIPDRLHFENFGRVMSAIPLGRQYFNSLFVSSAIVIGVLVTSVLGAYVFVFLRIPFRNTLFALTMLTLLVPSESLIIPQYLIVVDLGWINTYPGLIVPFLATGFGIFLMRQFFLSFPKEIYEASKIDGCGHARFIATIPVPIVRPALGVLGLYTFIASYNMYFWPLLVTNTPNMQTLQIGLQALNSTEALQPSLIYAGAAVAVAPMLIIFYVFQRNIVQGLTAGALK